MSTLVLGSGLSGLLIARELKKHGEENVTLVGKGLGGMQETKEFNDQEFSPFGCFLFKDKNMKDYMEELGVGLDKQKRDMVINYEGKLIDYPFQSNLNQLSVWKRMKILFSYLDTHFELPNHYYDFEHWAEFNFGKELAQTMIVPHTKKKYGRYFGHLYHKPFTDKMEVPGMWELFKSLIGKKKDWDFDSEFYSPENGMKDVISSLIEGAQFYYLNNDVVDIKPSEKMVRLDNGMWKRYDKLVSTIPIDILMGLSDINKRYKDIDFDFIDMEMHTFMLPKGCTPNFHAVYEPELKKPWHRITFPHNYVKEWDNDFEALTFEITNPNNNMYHKTYAKMIKHIYDNYTSGEDKLIGHTNKYIKSAYPVIRKSSRVIVNKIQVDLQHQNTFLFGRSSLFKYNYLPDIIRKADTMARYISTGLNDKIIKRGDEQ